MIFCSTEKKDFGELQKPDREPFDVKFNRGLNTSEASSEKLSRAIM
jgi:hypothetical protein